MENLTNNINVAAGVSNLLYRVAADTGFATSFEKALSTGDLNALAQMLPATGITVDAFELGIDDDLETAAKGKIVIRGCRGCKIVIVQTNN